MAGSRINEPKISEQNLDKVFCGIHVSEPILETLVDAEIRPLLT